jgi:hypothetical protein
MASYSPPYDSPIEDTFAYYAAKFLAPAVEVIPQVELPTPHGTFRVDFLTTTERKVAFECDGAEFHDAFRDEFRDALLLGYGCVDVIYHLPGAVITYYPHDALRLISLWDPVLFRPREQGIVTQLCTPAVKDIVLDRRDERVLVPVAQEERPAPPFLLSIVRRVRTVPQGRRAHWPFLFKYANERPGLGLDQLVAARTSEPMRDM